MAGITLLRRMKEIKEDVVSKRPVCLKSAQLAPSVMLVFAFLVSVVITLRSR